MTNELAIAPRSSLTERTADRFGIDPKRLLPTLKATAFKGPNQASDEQMIALLIVAEQYHLNPFTKELYAYPDKGGIVPVVSVDGWARIINEHPMLDGIDFEYVEDGSAITCVLHRKDRTHPTRITEFLVECVRQTDPWRKSPRRMLRHKALIQCARIAFGFAGIYDDDEAGRIVGSSTRFQPASASADRVRGVLHNAGGMSPGQTVEMAEEVDPQMLTSDEDITAEYHLLIERASDGEVAALVLDEARDLLTPEQHATLADAYRARWSNPKE